MLECWHSTHNWRKRYVGPAHTSKRDEDYFVAMTDKKPNARWIEFGRRAAGARRAIKPKMTQVDAAVAMEISRGFLAGIETGKDTPSIETLSKMAEVYGVSMDHLEGRTGSTGVEPAASPAQDVAGTDLLRLWGGLNDEQKRTIASALEVMVLANENGVTHEVIPKKSRTK